MSEVKLASSSNLDFLYVPSEALFKLVAEYMCNGKEVIIRVRGNSMYPLMRSNVDRIRLRASSFELAKKRDIVLIRRDNGAYILHRVCKKERDFFYMIGDNQTEIEGPLHPDQLLAIVTEVYRGTHTIRRGSFLWIFYASIWLMARSIRKPMLSLLLKLNEAINRNKDTLV